MEPDHLTNPAWHALNGAHRKLALGNGPARRYMPEVAPFAATVDVSPVSMAALCDLLEPKESLYLFAMDLPAQVPNLSWQGAVPCLQMVFPADTPLTPFAVEHPVVQLGCEGAEEMLNLINVAYPGFFRIATCRMGRYWGVRQRDGRLVGMVGERLVLSSPEGKVWTEISGLCRHPTLAPAGIGTVLLGHILAQHRAEGLRSWLHVTETNTRAVALYERLGFQTVRRIKAHRLQRIGS